MNRTPRPPKPLKDTIEYYIANGNNILVRSFGAHPEAAHEWLRTCIPTDKCTDLRVVSKTTTYNEVPRHE